MSGADRPPNHIVHDAVEGPPRQIRGPTPDGPLQLSWYGWQHKVGVIQRRLDRLHAYAHPSSGRLSTHSCPTYGIRDEMAGVLASGDGRLTIRGALRLARRFRYGDGARRRR
ncbi:MAG: hypothetical protein ACMVO3_00080 [Thalassobaculum sp.]